MKKNMDYYKRIFKRKSFHIFKDTGVITDDEMQRLNDFISPSILACVKVGLKISFIFSDLALSAGIFTFLQNVLLFRLNHH